MLGSRVTTVPACGEDGEVVVRGEGRMVDGDAAEFGAELERSALGELVGVQARLHARGLAGVDDAAGLVLGEGSLLAEDVDPFRFVRVRPG